MSEREDRYASFAIFLVIAATLLLLSWLATSVSFPVFRLALPPAARRLVPAEPFDDIAAGVSRFLWENRALDLVGQAFVIVAAVIACLALLKPAEAEG